MPLVWYFIMEGTLLVIDGTDGSGKTTQLSMLVDRLESENTSTQTLDFPQYDRFWGKMAGRFLSGEFGQMNHVHPYLVQPFYMLDQASKKEEINAWLKNGDVVLSNRYITSSMIHQTARLPEDEQEEFIEWLHEAGYGELGVVLEDHVIILYVDPNVSKELLNDTKTGERKTYTVKPKDIAEEDLDHQKRSAAMAKKFCGMFDHWHLIDCNTVDGGIRTREDIHEEVYRLVSRLIVE